VDLDHYLPAIAEGDAAAFAQWMGRAEAPLRASLRSFARSVDTEAVLQEALLRVWQMAPVLKTDGRPNALLRLALTTARHLAISEARRTVAAPEEIEALERLAQAEAKMPVLPDPLLRAAIIECREKLPNKPRLALDQRLEGAGGQPDADLARRLGMSLNTFLQNFTRARKLLAECLKKRGIILQEVLG
jgi:DNA-directed RNA polymerase specialized sigma24 family protein